jgi:transcriptional regulator with XRE-family HTH domain
MLDKPDIIAGRLQEILDIRSLKSVELCRQAGISPTLWSMYLTGQRGITLLHADKLVKTYRISLDWLYYGDASSMPGWYMTATKAKKPDAA